MNHRRYRAGDEPGILRLLEASFDGWHGSLNAAHFRWKFEDNPAGQASIWVAEDDGTIAGCYVFNPVVLRLGDADLRGAQSVDAAVHPDYQGRGIFTDLARLATEEASSLGFDLVYAFPSAGAYRGQIRVGFVSAPPITKMYRPLLIKHRFGRGRIPFDITTVRRFDERFDRCAETTDTNEISVKRSSTYLNWRYLDHPTRTYDVLACEKDGRLYGYVVLRLGEPRRRIRPGYVVDFVMLERSPEAAASLVGSALRHLLEAGAHAANCWARPSGMEQSALEAEGFSSRYAKLRRFGEHGDRFDEFITFDVRSASPADGRANIGRNAPVWSLVLGDADYG